MFILNNLFVRKRRGSYAEDQGWNDAFLGIKNNNHYAIGSIDHKSYEWGFNLGEKEFSRIARTGVDGFGGCE